MSGNADVIPRAIPPNTLRVCTSYVKLPYYQRGKGFQQRFSRLAPGISGVLVHGMGASHDAVGMHGCHDCIGNGAPRRVIRKPAAIIVIGAIMRVVIR